MIPKLLSILMGISFLVCSQPTENPYLQNPIINQIEDGLKQYSDLKPRGLDGALGIWNPRVVDADPIRSIEMTLGKYLGYDVIWWEPVSTRNCVACISLNYQSGPMFLLFHGYKSYDSWQIYSITLLKDISAALLLYTSLYPAQRPQAESKGSPPTFSSTELSRTISALKLEIGKLSTSIAQSKKTEPDTSADSTKTRKMIRK